MCVCVCVCLYLYKSTPFHQMTSNFAWRLSFNRSTLKVRKGQNKGRNAISGQRRPPIKKFHKIKVVGHPSKWGTG